MSAPRNEVVQMDYQNPHATMPLRLPVLVVCNTSDEDLERNIRTNAARSDLLWIGERERHLGVAILCGGGPSIADHLDKISQLVTDGGTVFATNAASQYIRGWGLPVHYQVIADAKAETASLVDPEARAHLFASQVNPATMDAVAHPRLWHLGIDGMEKLFPAVRVARGGYSLIGGGASVGNSACCLIHVMGYRTQHIFGLDSSHRDGESHAYDQPMNRFIPCAHVEWAGKRFYASVAMKAQAEKFQITGQALQQAGATLHVHGEGLLQTMWRTPPDKLGERDKYQAMWRVDSYRDYSPGEMAVPTFLEVVKPDGPIIDFGCGTGRASLSLAQRGYDVTLVDFADNCRDNEALQLPFLEWDLSLPCPLRAPYGICCDVMEHIPAEQVDAVIRNIMEAVGGAFFQISTVPDVFGAVVHQVLHNTVKPHAWWADRFTALGFAIGWQDEGQHASQFYVRNLSDRKN